MTLTRNDLISAARSLCEDFASQKDTSTLLGHFSAASHVTAYEHEEPLLLFLGRFFIGHEGVKRYFETLQEHITYADMSFSNYFADVESHQVCAMGKACFTWTATGQSWDEVFVYVLDIDNKGLVSHYQASVKSQLIFVLCS
jgi:hypothetical protein